MKTKRLFVAIPISKRFEEIFTEYGKNFTEYEAIRWTKPENFHITVFFVGDVEEKYLPHITIALQKVCNKIKTFTLAFAHTEFAPPHCSPRMIWGMFEKSEKYEQLAEKVRKALSKINKKEEREVIDLKQMKKPIAHTTPARFEHTHSAPQSLPQMTLEGEKMTIDTIALIESISTPEGTKYNILYAFPLQN